MEYRISYRFSAPLWQHAPEGGWHFVTLPSDLSQEIRSQLQWQEEGWGRMKVWAEVETLTWKTSIWFDTKQHRYLLPIKAEIRKKLGLQANALLEVHLKI